MPNVVSVFFEASKTGLKLILKSSDLGLRNHLLISESALFFCGVKFGVFFVHTGTAWICMKIS